MNAASTPWPSGQDLRTLIGRTLGEPELYAADKLLRECGLSWEQVAKRFRDTTQPLNLPAGPSSEAESYARLFWGFYSCALLDITVSALDRMLAS